MFLSKIIVILTAVLTLSEAYTTVQKARLTGDATEAISFLQKEFANSLTKLNITEEHKLELYQDWENVSYYLESALTKTARNFPNAGNLQIDPDAKRNGTELIQSKGFEAEEHYVTTEDGYILLIIRIRSPKPKPDAIPVFMQHGLISSSDSFIMNSRNESLAFILADAGYDVWLGNIRGNRYTTRHQYLQPSDKKFWQWSFDEMGLYDIPVMVNYVLSNTGFKKLNYVGHSEGTTNLISSVIANGVEMSNRINKFIALAPAVYVSHCKGVLRGLGEFAKLIQDMLDPFDKGDIFAHNGFVGDFAERFCYKSPRICAVIIHSIAGPGYAHFNITRLPMYLYHTPAGTSTQNLVHWSQQISAGRTFKYYDYGCAWKNFLHYKKFHPPTYDLKKFTVPTYAFWGDLDWLVTPPDAHALAEDLPNIKYKKFLKDYNHMDFVWGYNVAKTLYQDVLDILADKF